MKSSCRGLGNELKSDINSCDSWGCSPWVSPRQPGRPVRNVAETELSDKVLFSEVFH